MDYKIDDSLVQFEEITEDAEPMDDFDSAFWDEFYKREEEEIQTLTIEEQDDGKTVKIDCKLPRVRTN